MCDQQSLRPAWAYAQEAAQAPISLHISKYHNFQGHSGARKVSFECLWWGTSVFFETILQSNLLLRPPLLSVTLPYAAILEPPPKQF